MIYPIFDVSAIICLIVSNTDDFFFSNNFKKKGENIFSRPSIAVTSFWWPICDDNKCFRFFIYSMCFWELPHLHDPTFILSGHQHNTCNGGAHAGIGSKAIWSHLKIAKLASDSSERLPAWLSTCSTTKAIAISFLFLKFIHIVFKFEEKKL